MDEATVNPPIFRFSTDAFRQCERFEAWQETFGRNVVGVDTVPLSDVAFHMDLKVRVLPGLVILTQRHTPIRLARTRALLADSDDGIVLGMPATGCIARQFGREAILDPGDGVLLSNADVGSNSMPTTSSMVGLSLLRSELLPKLRERNPVLLRRIPRETEALRLLKRYVGGLWRMKPTTPALQQVVVSHVYDLVALALGATPEAAETARSGGVAAARRHAIKSYVLANLKSADLTAAGIARRLGVTPRYVALLLQAEGTTLTEFVRSRRLVYVHALLSDRRFSDLTISVIAYEAGFSDLSNFNHAFRQRYGASPSEVRHEAGRAWR